MWHVCTKDNSNNVDNQSFYLDIDLALERVKELAEAGYQVTVGEDIDLNDLLKRIS